MSPRNSLSRSSKSFSIQRDDWYCPESSCKNLNFARRTKCNLCGKSKPYSSRRSSSERDRRSDRRSSNYRNDKSRSRNSDDWSCAHCGNINWARRENCKN